MLNLRAGAFAGIQQGPAFIVSQTKINPLLCRGMKDLQIKERAPVLV